MKYIKKRSQPQELIAWIRAKTADQDDQSPNWTYDDMPANIRQAVKTNLVREQGGLCCYTGRRITVRTSHIEHLKPQCLCVNHEDTDYKNLLAAYPSSESNTPGCAYGAHKKADWYDGEMFVHPRRKDCEVRFLYRTTGRIYPANADDKAAAKTIEKLGLDDSQLRLMRKAAIDAALYEEPPTKKQAQRLLGELQQLDGQENYREFCFVIKQACEKYLKRFERPKC